MLRFCDERGVRTELCGKVVVATREEELPALAVLETRGAANGVDARRISNEELREREPAVRGVASLFVSDTGIVNYAAVTRAMADVVRERGGEVRVSSRVLGIQSGAREFALDTAQGDRCARRTS